MELISRDSERPEMGKWVPYFVNNNSPTADGLVNIWDFPRGIVNSLRNSFPILFLFAGNSFPNNGRQTKAEEQFPRVQMSLG